MLRFLCLVGMLSVQWHHLELPYKSLGCWVLGDQGKGFCFWGFQLDKLYHISDLSSKCIFLVIGFKCDFTNLLHDLVHICPYIYHMLTLCIMHGQTMWSRREYHTEHVDGVANTLFVLLWCTWVLSPPYPCPAATAVMYGMSGADGVHWVGFTHSLKL